MTLSSSVEPLLSFIEFAQDRKGQNQVLSQTIIIKRKTKSSFSPSARRKRPATRRTVGGRATQIHFSEGNHVSPLSTLYMYCVLTVVNQRLQIVFSNHRVSKWNEWDARHTSGCSQLPSRPVPPRVACRKHQIWAYIRKPSHRLIIRVWIYSNHLQLVVLVNIWSAGFNLWRDQSWQAAWEFYLSALSGIKCQSKGLCWCPVLPHHGLLFEKSNTRLLCSLITALIN